MSKIKRIEVSNWIGLGEFAFDFGKVNYLSGHKGSGKTSLVEALEKGFTNKSRRTEVIRHGADEARIFIQTDDSLEIERKVRNDKADYLKVRKPGQSVPSTETFLRKLINGEIFRPLEFVEKSPEEQAKIILNMLEIPWTMNDIQTWFSEVPGVNYEAHILQVLKQIENLYYTQRENINREIKVLEAQVSGIRNELPSNYDGEHWRKKKVSEYYGKVAEAEETNKKIVTAQNAINGLQDRIDAINANAELDKQTKKNAYDRQRADGREFIQFLNQKVKETQTIIDGMEDRLDSSFKTIDQDLALWIEKAKNDYQQKLQELNDQHMEELATFNHVAETQKATIKSNLTEEKTKATEGIAKCKNSITSKEQELINIDELENQAIQAIDEKTVEQIKTIDAEAGNAKQILEETEEVDTVPLKEKADEVAKMQSYLREFDRMEDIIKIKLAPKQELSRTLTARIEKAREMPMELLKIAAVPIPEINIDGNGKIRIGKTLLSDRSEGEQLELALRMAKAQAGELKVICVDGISKINPDDRKWLEEEMFSDDYQYFILDTADGNLKVEIKEAVQ